MTNLDIPTISFSHYLDLLKRRTWHVVIVSIIGLLIGGIVAQFIPRYYVATTEFTIQGPVLDPLLGTPQDPMSEVVKSAVSSIPRLVRPALTEELRWEKALVGTEEQIRAFIEATSKRVLVRDNGPANPRREQAWLVIRYADQDGNRAAALANTLRELWLREYVDGLKERARQDILVLQDESKTLTTNKNRATDAVAEFQIEHGISPEDPAFEGQRGGPTSMLSQEISRLQMEIDKTLEDIVVLEELLRERRNVLETLPQMVPIPPNERFENDAQRQEALQCLGVIQEMNGRLQYMSRLNPGHANAETKLRDAQRRLDELAEVAGGGAGANAGEQPNPERQAIETEISKLGAELSGKEKTLELRKERMKAKEARRVALPEIYKNYKQLLAEAEVATVLEEELEEQLVRARRTQRLLDNQRMSAGVLEAIVPSRPTEPNPFLVALLGCVIGLGVAVGLVLLIDLLQLTYKSVREVESGLGVPVLGSMSYLVTSADVVEARARRKRLTVIATIFLSLLLIVVTLYYVQRSSLPLPVLDLLDLLLGEPA